MERPAIVWLNGYFGRLSKRCVVVGETPKRYRVRWLEAVKTRGIEPGNITLVPKHAVEFTPLETNCKKLPKNARFSCQKILKKVTTMLPLTNPPAACPSCLGMAWKFGGHFADGWEAWHCEKCHCCIPVEIIAGPQQLALFGEDFANGT